MAACLRAEVVQHTTSTLWNRPSLQGAGAADAFRALRQQGAPQEELMRPTVLRPLVALAAAGGRPVTARLAAKLLRGIAEAGPDCCAAIRCCASLLEHAATVVEVDQPWIA